MFFFTEEDTSVMGLRSMSLVGNAGNNYDSFTPPIEDVELPKPEATEPEPEQTEPAATDPTAEQKDPNQQPPKKNGLSGGVIALIVAGAVALFAGGMVVGYLLGSKRSQKA